MQSCVRIVPRAKNTLSISPLGISYWVPGILKLSFDKIHDIVWMAGNTLSDCHIRISTKTLGLTIIVELGPIQGDKCSMCHHQTGPDLNFLESWN